MPDARSQLWETFLTATRSGIYEQDSPTAGLSSVLANAALIADLQMKDAGWLDTDPEAPGMLRALAVQVGSALWTALRTPEARTAMASTSPKRVEDSAMGYYQGSILMVYGLAELISSYTAAQVPASLVKGAVTAWASAVSLFVALADSDPENLWVDMLSSPDGSEAPGSIPEDGKGHQRSQEGV